MTSDGNDMQEAKPIRRQIRPHRAAELVAADIRGRILKGELDGGLPTETKLLEEFSVSRPTLREALRILETEGLVRTRRGKKGGASVSRPTADTAAYYFGLVLQSINVDLSDLATARQLLEPLCVSMAAQQPDKERIAAELDEINDGCEKVIDDDALFTASLLKFHEKLVKACGNHTLEVMVGTVERLWESQEQAWAHQASESGEYPAEEGKRHALESHRRITRRIAEGDAEGAARAARQHLAASMSFVCGPGSEDGSIDDREFARVVDAALLRN